MTSLPISPLAPKSYAQLPPMSGVRIGVAETGVKYANRCDLLLIAFDQPAVTAGVFTRSRCPSAPVNWCRDALAASNPASALLVNAGNANAFTGARGLSAVETMARATASQLGCPPDQVYLASTGVIGEPLDAEIFPPYLAAMDNEASEDNWSNAASAIMTTDTYPKLSTTQFDLEGETVTINGIAKGSGMIAPDMATMLSFAVTDLNISQSLLQSCLSETTDTTFNAITVDSDTSTSDTLMIFATGKSTTRITNAADPRLAVFKQHLRALLHDLALQVVRDGEGATKQVEITVTGAESDFAAKKIALSIANSPLVKTAIAGEDANWGRVVMAVGKAGEQASRDDLSIWFGDIRVAVNGERDPDYDEDAASAVMRRDEISIRADVGIGSGQFTAWTCDLTKQYVAINGDYRS